MTARRARATARTTRARATTTCRSAASSPTTRSSTSTSSLRSRRRTSRPAAPGSACSASSSAAWTNLGIKHINVDSVNLVVRQIPPENLVFWLGDNVDAATERTSDVILKKTIPLRGDPDAQATTWLDVQQLLPATTRGVLELRLYGVNNVATSRLLLTNMSLVAKKWSAPNKPAAQTVQVWALDMDSASPLSGVDVSLIRKSGKEIGRASC